MSEFKIKKIDGGKIAVYTPFDKGFIREIKTIGSARWDSIEKCWTVPDDYINSVREMMMDVYGRDDQDPGETVDCEIEFLETYSEQRDAVTFCGKTIARAWGRDSGAKIGDDVVFVYGKIDSGGSVKYWETKVYSGSEFIVKNIPKARFDKEKDKYKYIINVSLLEKKIDKTALLAEKEKLEKRIEEIDNLLAS